MVTFLVTSILIYVTGIFGVFGNIFILLAIYHMRPMVKSSCVVGLLAFGDLFCILSEWQNATRMILDSKSYQRECFWSISPYLFMCKMKTTLMCAVALDRLFAFTFPIRYIKTELSKYVAACCIPGLISAVVFLTLGASSLTDDLIPACNPPLAYPPKVSNAWNIWSNTFNCLTLLLSILALMIVIRRARVKRSTYEYKIFQAQRKLSKSCAVIIIVFLLTIFTTHAMIQACQHFNLSRDTRKQIETNAVLPAMISYSQAYYVYFWCSELYRNTFKNQLRVIFPCLRSKFQLAVVSQKTLFTAQ